MISIYEYSDGIAFIFDNDVKNELAFYSRFTKKLSYYDNNIFATEINYNTLIYITNEIIKYEERIKENGLDTNE